jgi:hypothetical protein
MSLSERIRENVKEDYRYMLCTASMPNLSGVSSSTVSFSCTVMIKGCKEEEEMSNLADLVNYD